MTKIPYKINLSEDELPKYWQNIRPYMQEAPDPFINPVTFKPCTADDLRPVFCDELIEQELDNTNKFIEIPEEIRDFYKMYRPSPLTRAYNLEKRWVRRQKFTTNSKALILPVRINSILLLLRFIMLSSKD